MQSLQDLKGIPITASGTFEARKFWADVADFSRHPPRLPAISHYNIRRVLDIYGSVQDRDLGRG